MEKQNTFHYEDAAYKNHSHGDDGVICGLVLAGGEGKRLQPFIRSLGKGTLPKQYINFIGTRSMLEHTLDRAERVIPSTACLLCRNRTV